PELRRLAKCPGHVVGVYRRTQKLEPRSQAAAQPRLGGALGINLAIEESNHESQVEAPAARETYAGSQDNGTSVRTPGLPGKDWTFTRTRLLGKPSGWRCQYR